MEALYVSNEVLIKKSRTPFPAWCQSERVFVEFSGDREGCFISAAPSQDVSAVRLQSPALLSCRGTTREERAEQRTKLSGLWQADLLPLLWHPSADSWVAQEGCVKSNQEKTHSHGVGRYEEVLSCLTLL